jgi:hypothetical protein
MMRQSRRILSWRSIRILPVFLYLSSKYFLRKVCVLVDQVLVCHVPLPELKVFFRELCALMDQVVVCHLPLPELKVFFTRALCTTGPGSSLPSSSIGAQGIFSLTLCTSATGSSLPLPELNIFFLELRVRVQKRF